MRRRLRYLALFCCSLLLILFLSQTDEFVVAQKPVQDAIATSRDTGVSAIAFSSDGQIIASGVKDGRIVLFDTGTGKEKRVLPGHKNTPVTGVAFKPRTKTLASVGRDSIVRVWDVDIGKQNQLLTAHENPTRTVAYSPDGRTLLSGGEDTRAALWDSESGKLLRILTGHLDFVNAVAYSPDSRTIATASEDARIILRNLEISNSKATLKEPRVLLGHAAGVTGIAFSPDGRLLASVSKDGTVRLWDVVKGVQIRILKGPTKRVTSVAFSPDGSVLAGGSENKIFLWDVVSGAPRGTLQGNKKSVTAVTFSPTDANTLVSADDAGEVIEWNVTRGQQKRTLVIPAKAQEAPGQQKSQQKTSKTQKNGFWNPRNKTLLAAIPPAPNGPILIITSPSNPFGDYYTEILRNEGLNYFNINNISSVSSATLANYDIVILADVGLTNDQVTMLSDWVNSGGNLIAMHPDKKLASLLGLTDTNTTLSEGYLLVNTSTAAGGGITNQTMQFHGSADRYTLNGATSIATLYTNATTATTNPAVTLQNVGSNGGQAAAFTYDLARSVIYTRQGNPDWAGQERDGFSPMRSNDMFFGNASYDPKSDWVDLNKVEIPQADEQQRLLANLILTMNFKKPLPRFWYFPRGEKAVVLMTGDDHGNGGTVGRFEQFKAQSPPGCSVENWECIRGTSYIYPNTPISNSQAASFDADGFEIGLHLNSNCSDFTSTSLDAFYTQQLSELSNNFPSIPPTSTQRHHCIAWSGWSITPEVELSKGIRLDTTYYYWPPIWVLNRPGFFTGSGMPMRLAKMDGTILDVYEANTQLTDESGQLYPYTINTLLDKALGEEEYYGVFDVNAHTDEANLYESDAVVASAKARGVPVISARQLLTWLDGRDSSSFGSLNWNSSNNTLSFTITKGTGANGLQAMLPTRFTDKILGSITRNGSPVTYAIEGRKGIQYATFSGDTGSYVATYVDDVTDPTVSSTSPNNGATNISIGTTITATFNEVMDPATINSSTFELRNSGNTLVAASVTYDATTGTATLNPTALLTPNATYTATLKGGTTDPRVKDLAGNALATDYTWSFTTASPPCPSGQPCSIWNSSAVPSNPSVVDPNAVELGVKFRSDVDGYITGIRFYKGSSNTGTHTGTLWSSGGQQLARAQFTNETASGWQQVNFSNPVFISANTVYIASYHTTSGYYSANNNYFANSGVDNQPLHALSNGESAGNGVYAYSSTPAFPNNTYQSSNYWVDVVFTTSIAPDTTPPTVSTTNPSNNATNVGTATTIQATFSEDVDPATINSNTFELRDASNTLVAATVSYNAANRTATLTPSSLLTTSTTYTATIKGGGVDPRVKDPAGNALAQNYSWSFTTGTSAGPFSIWDNTATPTVVTTNDGQATELGVKFRSSVNGNITGLRFYKGPQNTGTHVGTVWSSTGQQLGQVTFSNETASGWQQVNFPTPIPITANTVYIASYHTNVGFYSKSENFFTNSGVSNPPLYALRDGESGPNGVYNYSATPTFPNSTYLSSNYWVDVVFTESN